MTDYKEFFNLFIKITSLEDVPSGVDILVWDGCDFYRTYVDVDTEYGLHYDTNYPEDRLPFIAYFILPDPQESLLNLGEIE